MGLAVVGWGGLGSAPEVRAAEPEILVEFMFRPVPRVQAAVWLADVEGKFIQDVFVTQLTGKLGVGNRPGRWDFLSSWRFPYGPRPQVLPIWAHARGKTYPRVVFHDTDPTDLDSLGWHENTSSPEGYYCRPLADADNVVISTDTMTCPSPGTFRSDKGRLDPVERSFYPPRGDLLELEENTDSLDVQMFAALNDLDAVTGATPPGGQIVLVTARVPRSVAEKGPLVAWVEASLEHDENASFDFDRARDHFIDPRLPTYGVEYLGQPSVVYSVQFDAMAAGMAVTEAYVGYGAWDGTHGEIRPPDDTISRDGGSGSDRLTSFEVDGQQARFAVYSHGRDGIPRASEDGKRCQPMVLPPLEALRVEPVAFDRVRLDFEVPALPEGVQIYSFETYHRTTTSNIPLTEDNAHTAIETVFLQERGGPILGSIELPHLWGNYDYQVGVRYRDQCSNVSALVSEGVRTPRQSFAQVDGFCFVATAAYGAPWQREVRALRFFRTYYLEQTALGREFVRFYYAHSPALAGVIESRPELRGLSRVALQPLADVARLATGG